VTLSERWQRERTEILLIPSGWHWTFGCTEERESQPPQPGDLRLLIAMTDLGLDVTGQGIVSDTTYRQNLPARWLQKLLVF